MSTQSNNIQVRLSGGAANTNPATSLGGVMSSTSAPLKLFNDVTNTESINGSSKSRLVYAYNARATTLKGAKVYIKSNTPGTTTEAELGLGATGMNGVEPAIATDGAVPVGITFEQADSAQGALLLGDIPSQQKFPIWVRWRVNPGSPVTASDPITIRIEGSYEE